MQCRIMTAVVILLSQWAVFVIAHYFPPKMSSIHLIYILSLTVAHGQRHSVGGGTFTICYLSFPTKYQLNKSFFFFFLFETLYPNLTKEH